MTTAQSLAASVQQYQKTYDKAIEFFSLFEDADAPELLRMQKTLAEDVQNLLNISDLSWESCGNLGRHLNFLHRYLKLNDKASCAQDARDIVFFDLPTALRNLVIKSVDDAHFDQRLRDSVIPLVQGGHYDSAVDLPPLAVPIN